MNASTAYWENDKQMMAICDGFNTNVDTQENKNAGGAPNASENKNHLKIVSFDKVNVHQCQITVH
jgi:hypothetical protein